MYLRNNTKYRLCDDHYGYNGDIYVCYKNRQFYLMQEDEYLLQDGFLDIKILYKRTDYYRIEAHGSVVLFLKKRKGIGSIYDVDNRRFLLEDFPFTSFRKVKTVKHFNYGGNQATFVNVFDDSRYYYEHIFEIELEKPYSLMNYSLSRGVILGPLHERPEEFPFGYVIDDKTVHLYDGEECDISSYEYIDVEIEGSYCWLYYDKEDDSYYVLVPEEDGGLIMMNRISEDENDYNYDRFSCSVCVESGELFIYFDKHKMKITTRIERDDYGWTREELRDAAEIAYEGYSPSELGYED